MRHSVIAATALAAFGACGSLDTLAQAESAATRSLAATCANCHGTGGVAAAGSAVPALAGQSGDELRRKMLAYKEGKLAGTIMPQLAKGYTDAQIDAIAGWFAAQKAK